MTPDIAEKLIHPIQDLLNHELTKLQVSLRQGLSIKEYQAQDVTHQALVIALGILEAFNRQLDEYCADHSVNQCLKLIQDRNENTWPDLPENERVQRILAGIGFLAADMGLPNEAEVLFEILALRDPDTIYPLLGLAYVKLCIGSAHEALELIRNKVLNKAPGSDLGLAFLALACAELGKTEEALAAASAVITADRDESAVTLAFEVQNNLVQPVGSDNITY